jgi:hypothetical protein
MLSECCGNEKIVGVVILYWIWYGIGVMVCEVIVVVAQICNTVTVKVTFPAGTVV